MSVSQLSIQPSRNFYKAASSVLATDLSRPPSPRELAMVLAAVGIGRDEMQGAQHVGSSSITWAQRLAQLFTKIANTLIANQPLPAFFRNHLANTVEGQQWIYEDRTKRFKSYLCQVLESPSSYKITAQNDLIRTINVRRSQTITVRGPKPSKGNEGRHDFKVTGTLDGQPINVSVNQTTPNKALYAALLKVVNGIPEQEGTITKLQSSKMTEVLTQGRIVDYQESWGHGDEGDVTEMGTLYLEHEGQLYSANLVHSYERAEPHDCLSASIDGIDCTDDTPRDMLMAFVDSKLREFNQLFHLYPYK